MEKFSQLYLRQNKLIDDSKRARKRISTYFFENCGKDIARQIFKQIELDTGADIRHSYDDDTCNIREFLQTCPIRDFLDSITVIGKVISRNTGTYKIFTLTKWRDFIELVFKEEELRYSINDHGEIHYFIDQDFEISYQSTISLLNNPLYKPAAEAYQKAVKNLLSLDPDRKSTLKYVFEAAEIIFKKITGAERLTSRYINESSKFYLLEEHKKNPVSKFTIAQFKEWIDALHNYRHGKVEAEFSNVTEKLAVFYLTSGSAFIRWLVDLAPEEAG